MSVKLVVIEFNTVPRSIGRDGPAVRDFHRFPNIILQAKAVGFEERSVGNCCEQVDVQAMHTV